MARAKPKTKAAKKAKVGTVMREFKNDELHSGSKTGPRVKTRRQAIAIALNQSGQSNKGRRKGAKA
jgi:Family of unknown function (DUF6496)